MEEQKIKVSVILPVYNSEQYLSECLNSVINQTLRDIEIICVDDGSTDNSLKILNDFAKRDSRVTVLTQKHRYAGVARNKGMEQAKGEYLSFLDSDDFFEPTMLEEMYNTAVENDADIAICDAKKYFNGTLVEDKILASEAIPSGIFSCYDNPKIAAYIFQIFLGVPWNKLFKRSFVKNQNIYFSSTLNYNDMAFVMACLVAAHRIIFLPKYFIYWRWREDSLIHHPRISNSVYKSIHDLYDYISKLDIYPQVERSFLNHVVEQACHFYHFCQSEELKVLAIAYIKAFYREFEIAKYPEDYFYLQQNYRLFKKLAKCNLLPNSI